MKRPTAMMIALFFLGILIFTRIHTYYPPSKILQYSRFFPGQPIDHTCTYIPYDYINERYGGGFFVCYVSYVDPIVTAYGSDGMIQTFMYSSKNLLFGDLLIAFGDPKITRANHRWILHWKNALASTGGDFSPLTHIYSGIYLWGNS